MTTQKIEIRPPGRPGGRQRNAHPTDQRRGAPRIPRVRGSRRTHNDPRLGSGVVGRWEAGFGQYRDPLHLLDRLGAPRGFSYAITTRCRQAHATTATEGKGRALGDPDLSPNRSANGQSRHRALDPCDIDPAGGNRGSLPSPCPLKGASRNRRLRVVRGSITQIAPVNRWGPRCSSRWRTSQKLGWSPATAQASRFRRRCSLRPTHCWR